MSAANFVALAIGLFGFAGIVVTVLRYKRDDTTSIVSQQDTIFNEMRGLNDELRQTTVRLREERDALAAEVEKLRVLLSER